MLDTTIDPSTAINSLGKHNVFRVRVRVRVTIINLLFGSNIGASIVAHAIIVLLLSHVVISDITGCPKKDYPIRNPLHFLSFKLIGSDLLV